MSEALKKIKRYRRGILRELYNQLSPEQQTFFCKLHKSVSAIHDSRIDLAIDQCERTLKKNATRFGNPAGEIAQQMVDLLEKRKISIRAAAKMMETSPSHLHKVLSGNNMSVETLQKFANAISCKLIIKFEE